MLLLEKYGTDKEKNKLTYLMIPANHPEFPFPYNLEDRCKDIIHRLKTEIKYKLSISTKTVTKKSGPEKGKPSYVITIKSDKSLKDYEDLLKKENAEIKNKEAIINVE